MKTCLHFTLLGSTAMPSSVVDLMTRKLLMQRNGFLNRINCIFQHSSALILGFIGKHKESHEGRIVCASPPSSTGRNPVSEIPLSLWLMQSVAWLANLYQDLIKNTRRPASTLILFRSCPFCMSGREKIFHPFFSSWELPEKELARARMRGPVNNNK